MNVNLYKQHLEWLQKETEKVLSDCGYDNLIISAGNIDYYFADDRPVYFKTVPHFAHWCPLEGPSHLLCISSGKKPKLVFFGPDDFWHLPPTLEGKEWLDNFEVELCKDHSKRFESLKGLSNAAFIGVDKNIPNSFDQNPEKLTRELDWNRSFKTDWEVSCVDMANKIASKGHLKAKEVFENGGSELDIMFAYMAETQHTSFELPYNAIIGLDEHAATLHYEQKLKNVKGTTLLIDAGASCYGYASDITRTFSGQNRRASIYGKTISNEAHALFKKLISSLDDIHLKLIDGIKPGESYVDIHKRSCLMIFDLLKSSGIIESCPDEDSWKFAAVKAFFPHGLGHMLGLQVHDVSGKQQNMTGDMFNPNKEFPTLRNYRVVEKGNLFTIEPGIYFIPTLIEKLNAETKDVVINSSLVSELIPLGGIRIEDNIFIGDKGCENITRKYLP